MTHSTVESNAAPVAALLESVAAVPVPDQPPTDAFLLRAAAAARRAAEVRKMASAASGLSLKLLPLPDYLAAIAAAATVSLSRVLPNLSGSVLQPWVQLGRDIALPAERLRLLVRAFVAAREATNQVPVLARSGPSGGPPFLFAEYLSEHEMETRLGRIESAYPSATRQLLIDTLTELGL